MSAIEAPLRGPELLAAVSRAMLGVHNHYHGKDSATASSHMLADDMLACVLRDVYNDVERAMIDLGQTPLVHKTRSAFREAKGDEFVTAVERLSGRSVVAFMATNHVDPDLEVEVFVLDAVAG